jgi:hypothetical protein
LLHIILAKSLIIYTDVEPSTFYIVEINTEISKQNGMMEEKKKEMNKSDKKERDNRKIPIKL